MCIVNVFFSFLLLLPFADSTTIKCHKECIGGCGDPTQYSCRVCRNFRISDGLAGECVNKCPDDLYIYNSLCVGAAYCRKRRKQPLLGECRQYCDSIGSGNITDSSQCTRSCGPVEVDSLSASDLVRGCQKIRGDLFIRIQSGVVNTMEYLERNLGDIEEIEGVLKVYRSPVITSLSFLRNLRIIGGKTFENFKYTFVLMSNEKWVLFSIELFETLFIFHFIPNLVCKNYGTLRKKNRWNYKMAIYKSISIVNCAFHKFVRCKAFWRQTLAKILSAWIRMDMSKLVRHEPSLHGLKCWIIRALKSHGKKLISRNRKKLWATLSITLMHLNAISLIVVSTLVCSEFSFLHSK